MRRGIRNIGQGVYISILAAFAALSGSAAYAAQVISIGDGDTIRVLDQGRRLTIRLACIDTPEMAQIPYGAQARKALQEILPIGSTVTLKVHKIDRYGRTVAEIFKNGNLTLAMVESGQAFAYRKYLQQCDAKAYLAAEERASRRRAGVWAVPGGITRPWDFRRSGRSVDRSPASLRWENFKPISGQTYRCSEIGSYQQAQVLLKQGRTYLDINGDGEACESLR